MDSRNEFYAKHRAMWKLANEQIFVDKFPAPSAEDIPAQILRKGLAVSAFSLLEQFIEHRLVEVFHQLPNSAVSFHSFSDKLKRFFLLDALQGLNNRVRFIDSANKQAYIMANLKTLAGYDNEPPTYTAFGFSPKGSNVQDDDLEKALKAIGVSAPWHLMNSVTKDVGISRLSLKDDFSTFATRRHKSAHDSSFILPHSDLKELILGTLALGISFDIVLTSAMEVYLKEKEHTHIENKLKQMTFTYRFIDEQSDGSWKELSFPNMTTIKIYKTEREAVFGVENRKKKKFSIFRDRSGIPISLL